MRKHDLITIGLSPELHQQFKLVAGSVGKSMNKLLVSMVKDAVAAWGPWVELAQDTVSETRKEK